MPPKSAPLVSVVIAYYNRPEYVRESIESALQQTYPAIEVIVVDDGSTEEAHSAVLGIPGVTVIRQSNRGVAAARNRGVESAHGEFIIFLDHDDRLVPEAVASHLRAIKGKPKPGFVFGAIRMIDQAGRVKGAAYVCMPRRNYFLSLLESNPIHCPAAAMLSREAVLSVGGLDQEVAPSDDFDLYIRLARKFPVVRHTDLVAEYRSHGENVSQDATKMIRATNRVMDKVERTMPLSASERRRVRMGRLRAKVFFGDRHSVRQKALVLYFRLRSLMQTATP